MNTDPASPDVLAALTRIARGDGGVGSLAAVLARTGGMVLVVSETDAPAVPAALPGPGGRPVTRAFTSDGAANAWARAHGLTGPGVLAATLRKGWPIGLRESLARNDVGVVIDDESDHAIALGQGDIRRIIDAMEAPPAPSSPAVSAPTPSLLDRARMRPPVRPIEGPGRTDDASRAFWATIDRKMRERSIAGWQIVETLAFEMDVHVQLDSQSHDGLRWPRSVRLEDEKDRPSIVYLFAGADALRDAAVKRAPRQRTAISLSGAEAIRWIAAAPAEISFVAIVPKAQTATHRFTVEQLLPALFPAVHDIGELRTVPAAGLERLGRLPGARALRPECVRALVLGWRNLVAFKDQRTIEIDGRAWKPVASSLDAFFASIPRDAGRVDADPAGKEPPFGRWLAQLGSADGLVLDAASGSPLTLEPLDLIVLDRWSAHGGRQPVPEEIVGEVTKLVSAGLITAETAGRIVADLPVYWIAVREAGERFELLMVPDSDALCLFTSGPRAQRYIEKLTRAGLAIGFVPQRTHFGWCTNPLVLALDSFTEAWIDPEDPVVGGGLRLTSVALRAAVARLDETLKPRAPGFSVGA
jgi:hypothetical protein